MSTIAANSNDGNFSIRDDAGHSATVELKEIGCTIEIPNHDGSELVATETNGRITGLRKGKRVIGKITLTAKLADPGAAFQLLAAGKTPGFVSTSIDIGDINAVDWAYSFSYGAQTRSWYGEDAAFGTVVIDEADTTTIAFTAELFGPINSNDSTNGIKNWVSAR